jgi:two-component system cell cycle response regulator CpdR
VLSGERRNVAVSVTQSTTFVTWWGGRTAPEAKLLSKPFHLKDLVAEVDRLFQSEDAHGRL